MAVRIVIDMECSEKGLSASVSASQNKQMCPHESIYASAIEDLATALCRAIANPDQYEDMAQAYGRIAAFSTLQGVQKSDVMNVVYRSIETSEKIIVEREAAKPSDNDIKEAIRTALSKVLGKGVHVFGLSDIIGGNTDTDPSDIFNQIVANSIKNNPPKPDQDSTEKKEG